jgi:hypothetical protein
MSGAIPPLPQYAFMTWCPVTAQGQLYLLIIIIIIIIIIIAAAAIAGPSGRAV